MDSATVWPGASTMVGRNDSRTSLYAAAIPDKALICLYSSSRHHKSGTWYIRPAHSALGVLVTDPYTGRLFPPDIIAAIIIKIEGIQIHKNSLINTLSPRRLKKEPIPIGDTSTGVHGKK